jgi:hypothetical protein
MGRLTAALSRGVWVGAGVWLTIAAMSTRPAEAQLWAAVAVSPTTLYSGASHAMPSQEAADRGAVQACLAVNGGADCKAVAAVSSGCLALARPTKLVVNQYGYGTSATREGAAANALAECVKAGGADCQVVLAPCTNDDIRWPSPLPLPPPPAQTITVDPGLVGNWKFNVGPGGIWVWQIAANGTYTFASEAGDNAPSHDGEFTASNGKYTLHSESMEWDDQGTYTIQPGGNSVVMTGKLGTGTWLRISNNPIINSVGNGVRK